MRNLNHSNAYFDQLNALRRYRDALRETALYNDIVNDEEYFPRAFSRPRCPVRCGYPLYTSHTKCSN